MCPHDSYRPHIVTQWLHIHCFQSIEETRSHFFRNKHSICTTTVVLEWSFRPIGYSCNVHVTGQWINDSAWSQGSVRGPTANQFATQCLQYKPFAQEMLQYQKCWTMQGNQIWSTTCGCRCSLPLTLKLWVDHSRVPERGCKTGPVIRTRIATVILILTENSKLLIRFARIAWWPQVLVC